MVILPPKSLYHKALFLSIPSKKIFKIMRYNGNCTNRTNAIQTGWQNAERSNWFVSCTPDIFMYIFKKDQLRITDNQYGSVFRYLGLYNGILMHIYRVSSAIWSSQVVSISSGMVLSYIRHGSVRINDRQFLKIYIMGIPFSSNCNL